MGIKLERSHDRPFTPISRMTVVEAKAAVRAYNAAVKDKGVAASTTERKVAVNGVATAVKGECAPYVEDFFGCFNHRFALSSCTDATVGKMLRCQEQFGGQIVSGK